MSRYTRTPVTSGFEVQSQLNQNFSDIQEAIDDTLSRVGDQPNQMEADIDMNSNRIYNLPTAASVTEPVTLGQFLGTATPATYYGAFNWVSTATASQTLFTGITPAYSPGNGNLTVYINGVRQHPTAYTETSSTSVTFSSGLDAGDEVLFVINEAIVDNTVPASLATTTTYQQGSTGSVSRTVTSKLQEFVSPKDFGAVGDGVTDDTAAIQAALTASTGKIVVCPSGSTYKITSGLTVPANTIIWAFGAKFDCSSSHFTAFAFTNGGGIFGAEEIKGAGNSAYNANGVAIYCSGTNNHPAAPTFVNGPIVMYNKIKEWGSYGVYAIYCNRTRVEYNEFTKIGYSSLGGVSNNDSTFCNNYVNDVSPGSGGGDAYGAFFDRFNGTSETSDPRSYRCKMNSNVVRGVVAAAANNGHALDTHGGVEIEFIGNQIEGCEGGIFVTSSTISGSEALGPKRCIVANNTINCSLYNNYALIVRGAINGATVAEYADSNVVLGNTIFGGGVAGVNTAGAITIQATKNTKIDVGTIMQSKPFGICLNSDNLNFNISGGTISDCFDGSVSIAGGIAVRGNNNKGLIGGISFKYETAGLGTYVMVNSVVISGGLTGLDIDMGRCYFEGLDASHLAFNDGVGVNSESLYGYSKTESFTLTSGNSSTIKSVVFPKRFPSTPKVVLTNSGAIAPGGKTIALRTSAITATGFDIIAYPHDLTTWSATASADINWRATT